MRALGHVPALDGLRGIAIALVLSVHVGDEFLPGGRLGVDLFFVLSGFLITSLLVTEWHATNAISLRAFYRRRALRLFPALFTMLGVYVLVASALGLSGRGDLGSSLTAAGLGAFYVYNLAAGYFGFMSDGLGHLWSLGQEEQFYVLWPPVLLLALRRRARPRSLIAGLWALIVALLAWRVWLVFGGASGARLYTPDTHSDPILIGCLAGLLYSFGRVTRIPRAVAYIGLATSVAIIATLVEVNPTHHMFGRPRNDQLRTLPLALPSLFRTGVEVRAAALDRGCARLLSFCGASVPQAQVTNTARGTHTSRTRRDRCRWPGATTLATAGITAESRPALIAATSETRSYCSRHATRD